MSVRVALLSLRKTNLMQFVMKYSAPVQQHGLGCFSDPRSIKTKIATTLKSCCKAVDELFARKHVSLSEKGRSRMSSANLPNSHSKRTLDKLDCITFPKHKPDVRLRVRTEGLSYDCITSHMPEEISSQGKFVLSILSMFTSRILVRSRRRAKSERTQRLIRTLLHVRRRLRLRLTGGMTSPTRSKGGCRLTDGLHRSVLVHLIYLCCSMHAIAIETFMCLLLLRRHAVRPAHTGTTTSSGSSP